MVDSESSDVRGLPSVSSGCLSPYPPTLLSVRVAFTMPSSASRCWAFAPEHLRSAQECVAWVLRCIRFARAKPAPVREIRALVRESSALASARIALARESVALALRCTMSAQEYSACVRDYMTTAPVNETRGYH